jgi:tetratricopeptide (TPR) repeat protein
LAIYDHLLSGKVSLTQGQWVLAKSKNALLKSKLGNVEEALKDLDLTSNQVDNKILKGFLTEYKARILNTHGRLDEARELFLSALRTFNTMGIPILQCICHNNLGILHFRSDDHEEAEKTWNKGLKCAKEAGSRYLQGFFLVNLADIEMLKGHYEKPKQNLDEAMEIYSEFGDFESISYVHFNYALYYLEIKEPEMAVEHLRKAESIAYPSPSEPERKEWRKVFFERVERNGFEIEHQMFAEFKDY